MVYLAILASTTILLCGIFLHPAAQQCFQYSEPNTALVDSAYKTIDVANLGDCNLKCDEDEKCLSVNYWKGERKCDLNNATKAMYPEREKKDRTAIYANIREGERSIAVAGNCADVLRAGGKSGVHEVKPSEDIDTFKVYCDQTTDGGGWTVFQRRQDGSEDFYRGWADYKSGFGNLTGEFWLGLDKIFALTHQTENTLRVDLMDWANNTRFAEYEEFAVMGESDLYKLAVGDYTGNAGDSMTYSNGIAFSTKDRDNYPQSSKNCAVLHKGAWWYQNCHSANLNGMYHGGGSYADKVSWYEWLGHDYSLKRTEMKTRPAGFTTA